MLYRMLVGEFPYGQRISLEREDILEELEKEIEDIITSYTKLIEGKFRTR